MKAIIQTPTNGLANSLSFYTKLGYTILSEENPTLVSDGKAVIEINSVRQARAGVKLYAESWEEPVKKLVGITSVLEIEQGFVLADPSGTWIYLLSDELAPDVDTSKAKPSIVGNFAGLSLEVIDMNRAIKIWNILGFEKTMGDVEQGWLVLANSEGFGVSLMKPNMCPHLFFNPSMTFFNGKDNLAIIEKIRATGISIAEEITHFNKEGMVDNIIIRDPGGYGFFIFSD